MAFTKEELERILDYFSPDDGSSRIDEVEVDEDANIIALGHTCTKVDCNCVGGWWNKTGVFPFGNTKVLSVSDVVMELRKLNRG